MNASRRTFLKGIAAAAGVGIAAPLAYVKTKEIRSGTAFLPAASPESAAALLSTPASGLPTPAPGPSVQAARAPRSLVVIQLAGGNDGLATVLPYADGALHDTRSTLAFPEDQLLKLNDKVALHPNLKGLKGLWDAKKLAVVQGVGYPNPNRSHFASMDIWASATPGKPSQSGWLGRYLDAAQLPADNPFNAASVGVELPFALKAQKTTVASVQDASTFQLRTDPRHPQDHDQLMAAFKRMYSRSPDGVAYHDVVDKVEATAVSATAELKDLATKYHSAISYPQTPLGHGLQNVAQLMSGGFGTRVYYVQAGGFDTHANEKTGHDRLMSQLGDAVAAFSQDLKAQGLSQNTILMTWSEFGRRVKENGSGGTDHGTAAPMFVMGDAIKGGLVGEQPSLTKLDSNGDLVFGIDFRSVYNTILTKWLGMDGQEVLGQKFDLLPLFG